ncbi:conserved protein of unknown function [Magnetospirillum sp. XM-1]|uniref:hypothetical protein n=1 Tax=Magnetospirillum sp. XM-1 TaxID=1663591 RepID=UPI00073DC22B|nr:hypothetical protein [Magnetospirillum sp. XM-1]CUW40023.1 conserved protein of unknown function [Magnetospirillum sp. XM-1]
MSFLDKLKAAPAPTRVPVASKSTPISRFVKKVREQQEMVQAAIDGGEINTRTAWFVRSGEGYKFKILRSPLSVDGTEWFESSSLSDLKSLYQGLIDAANGGDEKLVKLIYERSELDKVAAEKKGIGRKKK